MERIGKLIYQKFETEFKITKKVKEYIENEGISLAILIPNAWKFYEVLLFDKLDENQDGEPDKKFGNRFIVIYNGITEKGNWNEKMGLETRGFKEKIKGEVILYSGENIKGRKYGREFVVNYGVIKNDK